MAHLTDPTRRDRPEAFGSHHARVRLAQHPRVRLVRHTLRFVWSPRSGSIGKRSWGSFGTLGFSLTTLGFVWFAALGFVWIFSTLGLVRASRQRRQTRPQVRRARVRS